MSRAVPLLAGVFLISLAFLGLQITLTRVLSVALSHHYVFVVVSLALLGLGLGGVMVHLLHRYWAGTRAEPTVLALFGAASAVVIAMAIGLILALAQRTGVHEYGLAFFAVILLPFLAAGLFFAELYRRHAAMSGPLYGADLAGAAAGAVVAVIALNVWGGIGGSFALAVIAAAGSLLLARQAEAGRALALTASGVALAATLGLTLVQATGVMGTTLPVGNNPDKEIHDAIHGPREGAVTDSRWSAFGRTDLITYARTDDHRDLYIDGTAGTPMYRFTGDLANPGDAVETLEREFPGRFPFLFMDEERRDNALIIGPGGGRDVLLAARAGFESITAVEVNRELLDIVRDQGAYNGGLYTDFDHIDVRHGEGRHFIKRSDDAYDLIFMSLPVTNTSRSREGFALTENFLLTEQAVGEYLDHLNEGGQLVVVTHDELAILRLLRITLDAMAGRGMDTPEAMEHIYILGSFPYPVFVVADEPFPPSTARRILRQAANVGFSTNASYTPHVRQQGAMNPLLQGMAHGQMSLDDAMARVEEQGHNLSAVTDNRPFFYHFEPSLPQAIQWLFWAALGASALVLLHPLARGFRHPSGERRRLPRQVLLFAAIGLGFMLVEVSLVQRLTLFLGDPVLSLAVLLFALLVFMGLGSLASSRVPPTRFGAALAVAALAVVALTVGFAWGLPALLDWLMPLELAGRIIASALLLAPLSFALGFPFPLVVRSMDLQRYGGAVPWMWAINGVFSVLGAVTAVVIAMTVGLSEVLLAGAVCYGLVLVLTLHPDGRPRAFSMRR
ncbi:class I SAM-dependent methyltransferase [Aquisalimonas asiatica]|uniref:class I SAM-dependent methyltransferase n=1 Tax=Aquisalimonas asiatica TaxID=406100 RepID=UPI0011138436|nr:class I SAM-dependent methyltransferase [Aquisalimonas asiatica]